MATGTGAAERARRRAYGGSALLVDRDQAVADAAAAALQARETALALDLADAGALAIAARATRATSELAARHLLETIEHLSDFAPLVTLLIELAAQPGRRPSR